MIIFNTLCMSCKYLNTCIISLCPEKELLDICELFQEKFFINQIATKKIESFLDRNKLENFLSKHIN